MRKRRLRVALLVGLVLLAGCAGGNGVSTEPVDGTPTVDPESATPATATTTASRQPSPSPDVSRSKARELAMKEEQERITAKLANASGIGDTSVGVYGETAAAVVETTGDAYVVRVTMSYSYSYDCNGNAGAVDGLTTETVYEVTEGNATLRSIRDDVKTIC